MENKIRVVFRRTPKDGALIAFFHPEDIPARHGNLMSYQTIGQHSEASITFYAECMPCKGNEYLTLYQELLMIGYDNLEIRERLVMRRRRETK